MMPSAPSGQPRSERTLILLRHAKSDWKGEAPDLERPLAKRGRRQAPESGRWLNANLDRIDLAVVSPAERTRSTWDLVAAQLGAPPSLRIDDRLYAATAEELLAVVQELPDELGTVVLVGHNPGIKDLVSHLSGEWVPMPTSAIAVIGVHNSWAGAGESTATLRAAGRPPTSRLGT